MKTADTTVHTECHTLLLNLQEGPKQVSQPLLVQLHLPCSLPQQQPLYWKVHADTGMDASVTHATQ